MVDSYASRVDGTKRLGIKRSEAFVSAIFQNTPTVRSTHSSAPSMVTSNLTC